MKYIKSRMLDRELKKGSAELLILSLVEDQPRHGYDLSKLIETRSDGVLKFRVASLYPLLYRLEKRGWIPGRWIEKAGPAPPPLLPSDAGRRRCPRLAARHLARVRRGDQPHRGSATMPEWPRRISEEMRQHLDDEYDALRASGVGHDEAMRQLAPRRRRSSRRGEPGRSTR